MNDLQVRVLFDEPGASLERRMLIVQQLREELLSAPVHDVTTPVGEPAPDGTRGDGMAAVGILLVHLLPNLPTLLQVVDILRAWVRREPRTARLELDGDVIDVSGVSETDMHNLVSLYIDRHRSLEAPQ